MLDSIFFPTLAMDLARTFDSITISFQIVTTWLIMLLSWFCMPVSIPRLCYISSCFQAFITCYDFRFDCCVTCLEPCLWLCFDSTWYWFPSLSYYIIFLCSWFDSWRFTILLLFVLQFYGFYYDVLLQLILLVSFCFWPSPVPHFWFCFDLMFFWHHLYWFMSNISYCIFYASVLYFLPYNLLMIMLEP